MAQITYVNKEYLYENGDIPAKNKVQDTDMNEIKNVVNSNETKELLAVTNTAPAQCSTGDKYFNTSTKKIYTATATNTWETTGVNPTRNTIYLEFTTQTAYAYDGDTLVSVGGGSGSQVVNDYSTSQENAYSCDYSNKAFGGTILYNNTSGTTGTIQLSDSASNYSYIEILYFINASSNICGNSCIIDPNVCSRAILFTSIPTNANWSTNVRLIEISGTSITNVYENYINLIGSATDTNTSDIKIYKVIGYK